MALLQSPTAVLQSILYDGSIRAYSSSVRTISCTGSIRSEKDGTLMSQEDGKKMSKFQSKPCEALTHVISRGDPSRVPKSKTECSTLLTEELSSEGRLL